MKDEKDAIRVNQKALEEAGGSLLVKARDSASRHQP
jgi:hypothetical protein